MTDTNYPRYQLIARELREAIALGEFPAGSTLPTEHKLAARFGVCRMTVREGLKELRKDGVIRSRQGAGTIVTKAQFASRGLNENVGGWTERSEANQPKMDTIFTDARRVPFPNPSELDHDEDKRMQWLKLAALQFEPGDTQPVAVGEIYLSPLYPGHLVNFENLCSATVLELERQSKQKPAFIKQDIEFGHADASTAKELKIDVVTPSMLLSHRFRSTDDKLLHLKTMQYRPCSITLSANLIL